MSSRRRRGFGTLEVMAAISLMAIAFLSVGTVSIRMSRSENEVARRAGQATALRRSAAYWSAVPYSALPAAGTRLCDTVTVTIRVQTCATASTVAAGSASLTRMSIIATLIDGTVIRTDSATVDRAAPR